MTPQPTDATTISPMRRDEDREGDIEDSRDTSTALPHSIRFEDVFCLEDIQRIQDAFAEAADVASCITDPDGRPLTRPSNVTSLCRDVLDHTESGRMSCLWHDIRPEGLSRDGPSLWSSFGDGLLDGGTSIFIGGRHLANWRIGQVIDVAVAPEALLAQARLAGADEAAFLEALARTPRMSRTRFQKVCQALHHFANHLSSLALKGFDQSRLIDELRQAQERIKTRDRNLADIIDFLPDPTLVVDKDGQVIFWNKAMERLTNVAAMDMLGKSDFAYGVPFYGHPTPLLIDYARGAAPLPEGRYAVAEIGQGEIIAEVSLAALPGGPRHIWAKAVALHDEAGQVTGAIEAIRDVTKRHCAEEALRESEEKFRRIVETANEGVWVFDADYKTTFVNRRMAAMLGYDPEEMLGKDLDEFVPDDQKQAAAHQQERRRQGYSDIYERCYLRKDGTLLWVLVSASPLYDASGHYIGALGMFTDITARKAVEEELRLQRQRLEAEVEERTRDLRLQALELAEANIRLSELDRLKSAFLSTVSHELRTPLTSILGFAKLIGRDFGEQFRPLASGNPVLESKGRRIADNLAVVFNEAERLTRLINDVLDLNRIESGSMQWRDCRIAPLTVLRQAAQSIEGLLASRPELSFVVVAPDDLPDLHMDPDQLVQVVCNLLQNAVKFTPCGEMRLEVRRDGDAVLIVVRDQGVGIPEDQLESIFDKFHQVGRGDTVADTAKGTGLGLAICRQIVRHYGGRIWATSELGKGSAFYVRLPLAEAGGAAS